MSNQSTRLPSGGHIDRNRILEFEFNGRNLRGYHGDTLASALMANGIDIVSRSFKYHRPRGFQSVGHADISSMVQVLGSEDAPNLLASVIPLRQGLRVRSVNCWPSLNLDIGTIFELLSPVIPTGFYYKTFMWPHWHMFEPLIRKAAGFGHAPDTTPVRTHINRFDHCDVLVIGAGPSGLSAALAAARTDARVILVDDGVQPGGALVGSSASINGKSATEWIEEAIEELDKYSNATRLQHATAWGYFEGNHIVIYEHSPNSTQLIGCNRRVWAKQVIFATGAFERPIVFENNDRPGVMLASAVSSYIRTYAVKPGQTAVVFTNNNSAYRTIADLDRSGISVSTVIDTRSQLTSQMKDIIPKTCQLHLKSVIRKVHGSRRVTGVSIQSRTNDRDTRKIQCDLVCVSGGWNPIVHLFSQSGGNLDYDDGIQAFVPSTPAQNTWVAGSANGTLNLENAINEGFKVGQSATTALGLSAQPLPGIEVSDHFDDSYDIDEFWNVHHDTRRAKAFVDLAGDVTLDDLFLAMREGYESVEHLKRYTTTGMGLDQGKTSNVTAIGIMARRAGVEKSEVGTTTFRPPYIPVEFGALAGSRNGDAVLPYRHTPMTQWHKSAGAVMFEAGARWLRPSHYPRRGEDMEESVRRECRSVREGVGIYDGSPLAKFAINGPDSEVLLNLLYTNSFSNLKVRQGRYGIMLLEDGRIFDDGVTFRLDDDEYLMTGTTGNGNLLEHRLNGFISVERPDLDVRFIPVTSQWANATVCGPLARTMLEKVESNIGFAGDDFPFMHMREGLFADMPVRIFRVSFTGELSYEINTPARYGLKLWTHMMEIGHEFGITPVGSEANHVLRVEKGFISLAHEVDGTTDPYDLGMGWIVSEKKPDFVGMRALQIRRAGDSRRQQLIGLRPTSPTDLLPEGAPLVSTENATRSEGFVSAGVWSPTLNESIALGLLVNGRQRIEETVYVNANGKISSAVVTEPTFYDRAGERLRM